MKTSCLIKFRKTYKLLSGEIHNRFRNGERFEVLKRTGVDQWEIRFINDGYIYYACLEEIGQFP